MVFLDASAIIYLLEGEPDVRQAVQHVLVSVGSQDADPAIAISALSLLECRVHPMRNADVGRLDLFDAFFEDPGLIIVDIDRNVIDRATLLRARHSIRTPDALQAACCIELGQGTAFVTGDHAFHRVPDLDVHLIT